MLWAVRRFGVLLSLVSLAFICAVAMRGMAKGYGPFGTSLENGIPVLQIFMFVTILMVNQLVVLSFGC